MTAPVDDATHGSETTAQRPDTASDGAGSAGTTADSGGVGGPVADGGSPGFDEVGLHAVVPDAVEDAILGAVGTLIFVAVGLLFLWSGLVGLFRADGATGVAFAVAAALGGAAVIGGALRDALSFGRLV